MEAAAKAEGRGIVREMPSKERSSRRDRQSFFPTKVFYLTLALAAIYMLLVVWGINGSKARVIVCIIGLLYVLAYPKPFVDMLSTNQEY